MWTESTDEWIRSYANGIPTGQGGTHENGLKAGVGKAIRSYMQTKKIEPKGAHALGGRHPRGRRLR